jgi:hypothetical protein
LFIERTEKHSGNPKVAVDLLKIIPGDWGKAKASWLV